MEKKYINVFPLSRIPKCLTGPTERHEARKDWEVLQSQNVIKISSSSSSFNQTQLDREGYYALEEELES